MRASSPAPSLYNQSRVPQPPFCHTPPPYPEDDDEAEPMSQPMEEDEGSYDYEDPRLYLTRSYATAHDRQWVPRFLASDEDCCDPDTSHLIDDLSDLRTD